MSASWGSSRGSSADTGEVCRSNNSCPLRFVPVVPGQHRFPWAENSVLGPFTSGHNLILLLFLHSALHCWGFQEVKVSAQISLEHQVGGRCLCGCIWLQNVCSQWCSVPCPCDAFSACFIVWTNLSARPFVAGWCGVDLVCCTPLACRKASISCETRWGPSSETSSVGDPNRLHISLSASMVFSVVVDFLIATSGHLLHHLRNPKRKTQRSICTWCHGFCGDSQGWMGASGSDLVTRWTAFSYISLICLSISGHQK